MRFCQTDGTSLVADAPLDPYKTMVARPEDIKSTTPPAAEQQPTPLAKEDEQVLEIPTDSDPNKATFASDGEIRREMDAHDRKDEQVIDIPPLAEAPPPPKYNEPEDAPPSFDGSPPPSPFLTPQAESEPSSPPAANIPSFAEPEPIYNAPAANPFEAPTGGQMAQTDWSPPPAPDTSWQNQQIGQNTPFQPPAGTGGGQSQGLAIASLVTGILSLICCGWILPGIAAVVMGFIAKNKADSDPANYGGRGLALAGIITGGVSVVLGIIVLILYFAGALVGIIGNAGAF